MTRYQLIHAAVNFTGGDSIQQECCQFVRQNGRLMPGQIFVSGPGKLKCKKIIHAVGPRWKNGSHEEDRILYTCIDNCFEETKKWNFQSIAIPPVSTGIFGYPLPKAIEVIVDVLHDRSTSGDYLPQRILLVDNKSDSLPLYKKKLEEKSSAASSQSIQQSKLDLI